MRLDSSYQTTQILPMITPHDRIAILLHEGTQGAKGKTGLSLLRYSDIEIVAVIDQTCAGQSLPTLTGINKDIPIVASVSEALAHHPTVLAIGIAPSGGALPDAWLQEVHQGIAAGLSVMNGLHTPIVPQVPLQPQQWIWEVRREPAGLTVGSGQARSLPCTRVLTVGTDMSVGKMSTSLELHKASIDRGLRSRFIATGQTGLMLGHDGIPLDAVRIDFASGAVEQVTMRYGYDYDILHIEGQGSFINPASTATLPLILVHRAGQTHIQNFNHVAIPPLSKVIQLYETVAIAGGAFAPAKVAGIALNTFGLSEAEAAMAIEQAQLETGLPCTDVVRFGAEVLLDAVLGAIV
jgi:uncharacterized NAD-dependent epimerase/dehydratase family protein